MGKPVIPVAKSNGSRTFRLGSFRKYGLWFEAMQYSPPFRVYNWFGYALLPLRQISSINFMHKIACITGALLAKRGERCIVREARDESPPRTSPRLALRTCFALLAKCCVRLAWLIQRLLCRLCTRFLLGGFCVDGKHPLVSFSRTSKETWHVKTQKKVRNDLNLLGQSPLQTRLWLRSYRSPFREIPHFSHCQTHSRGEPKEYKHRKNIRPVPSKHWRKVQSSFQTFRQTFPKKKKKKVPLNPRKSTLNGLSDPLNNYIFI